MSKFNGFPPTIGDVLSTRADATVNHEGGAAFTMTARDRLVTRVLASFCGEPKYYESGASDLAALRADVVAAAAEDAEFPLRLAAFARQEFHMRSTPIAVLVAAAAIPASKPFVRRWTPQIVRRADEPAEVLAAWIAVHGHIGSSGPKGPAFPHSLRNGLADALVQFDEYAFAKYDRERAVKIRDVLRIVRPKPTTAERSALYRYLVRGDLDAALLPKLAAKAQLLRKSAFDDEAHALARASHATWEVLVSKFGSRPEVWNALQLPFMAGIRNLANLMRNGASDALDRVLAQLRNAETVRRSQQLPFRFFSAYRAIEPGRLDSGWGVHVERDERIANHPRRTDVLEAILQGLDHSVANVPHLAGSTFITADNSGSMENYVSAKSTVRRKDVANLLAAIAHRVCDSAIVSVFGESHAVVPVIHQDSVLTNMRRLAATDVGHATNAYLAIAHLRKTKTRVDRIIVFSDMQCYDSHGGRDSLAAELTRYRREVAPEVRLYSVDLAGYGTAQFPADDPRTVLLAGWSEKLLSFIPTFESGSGGTFADRIASWQPEGMTKDADDEAA